ncbi:isopeptide-forming domain-containing fimbrial protein, partial [Methanobacterium sp.]|uniref:isopeptide-forming domain-containing fimbrial protein n=1 Tax=Methanobacterium sp. TaxID=2164 RepID=UPI002AB9F01F
MNETNTTNNSSSTLPDPKLYDYNGNLVGSYATIQQAYNNAATGTSTQMYTIELEENGVFTLTDFTIAKNLIFTVANGGTATIQGSNDRLIYIASGYTVYFYNITFENGHASDGTTLHPDGYNGGAIYNEGTLYLTDCVLRNNQAGDGGAWDYGGIGGNGGAIYNTGTTTITNCEIYNNRAGDGTDGFPVTHSNGFQGGDGGAIYSTGTLNIINSELYNNLAGNGGNGVILGDGGNGGNGGAIYNTATMTITDSLIHNNFAGDAGAGGYQVIIGGTGGTGGNGGAIYNIGTAIITDSQINENIAGDGGSGADGSDGLLSNGYTGHNGGAGGSGGAIYNTNHLEIYGTEISDNEAGDGGEGGNGGNSGELGTVPYTGGNGGQGGAGGNGGGIFNSNYLLITESTVTSNRSGNGGTGGNGGQGSDRWRYYVPFQWVYVPSGNGGNGGAGGNSGSGAGIYHSGTYLLVTSNNLTNNIIGTPGNGGAAGLKGSGAGGSNGNAGAAGTNGTGGAVYLATNIALPQINYNRILNNTLPDIANYNGISVNAENNWWGTNFEGSSPSIAGRVSNGVDADPWVILRLIVPDHIYNGIPVQFIGDLTQNSAGNPVGGYIPNGVEANFTATLGLIDPTQYTSNGQANTTYSPTSSGPATFTVKVDNQIVTVNQNVEPRAVLDFTKSVSDSTPNYGDLIHFIVTVQNNGPDTATDVNVSDLLPAGLVYQSHTLNAGSYDYTTGLWSIGSLTTATGGVYLDIIALVNGTGFFNNTATLTQSTYPQDAVNRSATLNVDPAAIISVTKTDNTTNHQANVGDNVTFTITTHNNGPDNATNIIITDTLPLGLDFVSASNGGIYNTLTRTITWTAFNLNYGAPDVIRTFIATINADMAGNTTGITNTANATYTEYPQTTSGTDTPIYVPQAEITITKTDNTTNHQANVGDNVTFTITTHNNG